MGLSLQNLRDRLRKATGTDTDDLTNADADLYLNMSWWELQDKVNFREREFISEFTISEGDRSITLSDEITSLNHVISGSIRAADEESYSPLDLRVRANLKGWLSRVDRVEKKALLLLKNNGPLPTKSA